MSDTPRTDASAFWVTSPTDPEMQEEVVVSHFARQLELELQQVTKERDEARQHIQNVHRKEFGFP